MIEVVAALIRAEDRFMICRRPEGKARAMLWEFPGGKIEPGETPRQALVRECREELDIDVTVGEKLMTVVHEYPDLTVCLSLFLCSAADGEPQLKEHSDMRWITAAETDGYAFCPADADILKMIKERFGGKA